MPAIAALLFASSAHADVVVDNMQDHLAALSAVAHSLADDETGQLRAMAVDAQHHTLELAPLLMRLEATLPGAQPTDIGDRVLTELLSLDAQLKAAAEIPAAQWPAATDKIMRTTLTLNELSTALANTAGRVAIAD